MRYVGMWWQTGGSGDGHKIRSSFAALQETARAQGHVRLFILGVAHHHIHTHAVKVVLGVSVGALRWWRQRPGQGYRVVTSSSSCCRQSAARKTGRRARGAKNAQPAFTTSVPGMRCASLVRRQCWRR